MPELPEVEVVRRGLAAHVLGRTVADVEVRHPRAVRRHLSGPLDFTRRLTGRRLSAVRRRGKYLWLELDDARVGCDALLAHLGMSGQLLVQRVPTPPETHLRVVLRFADAGPELRFVDQRTFGGLALADLVEVDGELLPRPVAHIARDPLDPAFDVAAVVAAMRRRRTAVKRALLDQGLVSGIGNIYADEALWRAGLHGAHPTAAMTRPQGRRVLAAVAEVMTEALRAGGTSFDALYVNVNGRSGYFDRSLAVYGRAGQPCPRCGTPVRREPFMNRSSYSCPRCQPGPRAGGRRDTVRMTAWVRGRVQGVGFRWWTRCRALELGLVGSAANLPDGRVEVVAEGPREACAALLAALRGPGPPGRVEAVVARWDPPKGTTDTDGSEGEG